MEKSPTCDIEFDENPLKIYYGGQLLQGSAIITFHKPQTVRGIYVNIEGNAHCKWNTDIFKLKKIHAGDELYFSEKTFLVGGDEGEIEIQPGCYTYTFQCNLPHSLPTSLEGNFGYIRYTVLIMIDGPPIWSAQFIEPFTVIKALNLNDIPNLGNPLVKVEEIAFNECCYWCCCCCSHINPIVMIGNLPRRGYTPGEEILVSTTIDNKSINIRTFSVRIVKIIEYYTHKNSSSTKREEIIVANKEVQGVARNQVKTFDCVVVVPPNPPTDIQSSDICKVTYVVRIHGNTDVFCEIEPPELDIPITIGTYPLNISDVRSSQHVQPATPSRPSTPSMPTQPSTPSRPSTPSMPTQPSTPSRPSTPSMPTQLSTQSRPSTPSTPITHQPMRQPQEETPEIFYSVNPTAPLEEDSPTYEEVAGNAVKINGRAYKPRYIVYHHREV